MPMKAKLGWKTNATTILSSDIVTKWLDTGRYFVVYILQNVLFWLGLCTSEGHLLQI